METNFKTSDRTIVKHGEGGAKPGLRSKMQVPCPPPTREEAEMGQIKKTRLLFDYIYREASEMKHGERLTIGEKALVTTLALTVVSALKMKARRAPIRYRIGNYLRFAKQLLTNKKQYQSNLKS